MRYKLRYRFKRKIEAKTGRNKQWLYETRSLYKCLNLNTSLSFSRKIDHAYFIYAHSKQYRVACLSSGWQYRRKAGMYF